MSQEKISEDKNIQILSNCPELKKYFCSETMCKDLRNYRVQRLSPETHFELCRNRLVVCDDFSVKDHEILSAIFISKILTMNFVYSMGPDEFNQTKIVAIHNFLK